MTHDPFVTRLRREIDAWAREGLVSPEQAARLAARYAGHGGTPSRFVAIITLVGAVLVTAGVGLVIAHNWERLGDGVKIGGLIALMMGAYAAAFELRARELSRTGEALLMAGGALFLCGIALVGQIYHLNDRPPNAVLLWLVAILPLAWMLRSSPLFFLGVSGAVVWLGMETARPDSWAYLGSAWGDDFGFAHQLIAPTIGALLISLGALPRERPQGFRRALESTGMVIFLFGIYLLSFQHKSYRGLFASQDLNAGPYVLFSCLAAGGMALAWRLWPGPARRRALFCGMLLAGVLTILPNLLGPGTLLPGSRPQNLIAGWCAIFGVAASILFISVGLHWGRTDWITLGLVFVGLNIVTRYFDYFGDRLDQGIFFVVGGLLLLGLGIVLERQRRRLLGRVAASSEEDP